MATLLQLFRRRRAWARAAFMVGATVKLAPYLTTPAHAQQNVGVNIRQVGSVDAVSMPFICDNSTGIQSTVIYIQSTQEQVVSSAVPGSSKAIFACGFQLTTADSTAAWKWVTGTSTDCTSNQANVSGTFNASSKWGIAVSNGGAVQFRVSSGQSLCIDTTSSGIQGLLTFATST